MPNKPEAKAVYPRYIVYASYNSSGSTGFDVIDLKEDKVVKNYQGAARTAAHLHADDLNAVAAIEANPVLNTKVNEFQRACLEVYADGDFKDLGASETCNQLYAGIAARGGDKLLVYLLEELSDESSDDETMDREQATRRMDNISNDVAEIAMKIHQAGVAPKI